MRDKQLPDRMRRRIRANYRHYLATTSVLPQMAEVYSNMTNSLRQQVTAHVYKDTLYQVPMLMAIEGEYPGILAQLALLMKPIFITKGGHVLRVGDTERAMYFIVRGEVEVLDVNNRRIGKPRGVSDYFGELSLFVPDTVPFRYGVSVRVIKDAEFFSLPRSVYLSIKRAVCADVCRYMENMMNEDAKQSNPNAGAPWIVVDVDDSHELYYDNGDDTQEGQAALREQAKALVTAMTGATQGTRKRALSRRGASFMG
jgi:CRP-like cAMP-binding protein